MRKAVNKLIIITLILGCCIMRGKAEFNAKFTEKDDQLIISTSKRTKSAKSLSVKSPDKKISVTFDNSDTNLSYSVSYKGKSLVSKSKMGFKFKDMPSMDSNFEITDYYYSNYNETWEQPWGEQKVIKDNHNLLSINLKEKIRNRILTIEFKVFDEGVGFRYIVPKQENIDSLIVMDELTEFAFPENHKAWNIEAYTPHKYELLYELEPIKGLAAAHTPLTIKTKDGIFISIHEAALTDYSSMTLFGSDNESTLNCDLVPWKDGTKVKAKSHLKTPWRTIQIADKSGGLIESNMILNLNEPNKLGDVSWVKPMKYIGIWWGIHIDKWTFHQSPRLGATTENTIKYIDFAAKHGFDEVLVEGWNEGFVAQWGTNFAPEMNFTTPNPHFNLFKLQKYAKSKGVTLQAYNETAANTENYLTQIDSAMTLYESLEYRSAKIGHVNGKFKNGEWHHGQYGVNYYRTVVKKAAKHHIVVNFHEPIKDTGERRTYPNMVSREGARGQEYNAWGNDRPGIGGNPPDHLTILPFTRMLSGPMDFTPGIFRVDIPQKENDQVNTTLSKQLAIYVVIYSPIQMAADLIENYEGHPAFQFIMDVPVNWETSKVLEACIGDYIIMARKDVNSDNWYLGGITDEQRRVFSIKLDFLENGQYEAQIYQDTKNSDYETNPLDYEILKKTVTRNDNLELKLARSGGVAIQFKKIK